MKMCPLLISLNQKSHRLVALLFVCLANFTSLLLHHHFCLCIYLFSLLDFKQRAEFSTLYQEMPKHAYVLCNLFANHSCQNKWSSFARNNKGEFIPGLPMYLWHQQFLPTPEEILYSILEFLWILTIFLLQVIQINDINTSDFPSF